MSNRVKAKNKIGRSLVCDLWGRGKGKTGYPGQHGAMRVGKKPTDYGLQLQAKKKLQEYYDRTAKQLRRCFFDAANMKGNTADNLIGILEQHLISIVYHSGIAPTVFAARQIISHKHILVNDKIVTISSYRCQPGDVIQVRDRAKEMPLILESIQHADRIPDYLDVDPKNLTVKFLSIPKPTDVPYPVVMEPNLVIEFFSR